MESTATPPLDSRAPAGPPAQFLIGRFETLDALRGLAALLIFVFHFFALYPAGQLVQFASVNQVVLSYFATGVPLFYALSGVSLYIGFFRNRSTPGFARGFYLGRFFRIAPLFYTATLIWFLIFLSRGVVPGFDRIITTLSFLFNLLPGYHESFVAAGWSVGVEMLFYAVFPLLVARVTSARTALAFLAVMGATAAVALRLLTVAFPHSSYPGLSVLVHGHYFAAGIAVFFLANTWLRVKSTDSRSRFLPVGALIFALASIGLIGSGWLRAFSPFKEPSLMTVIWVLPIMALLFSACTIRPSQGWLRPFARLGEWSFSLYLLHPVVLYFVFEYLKGHPASGPPAPREFLLYFLFSLAVLIALSAVSFRWIEKPAMDFGRRLARRPTLIASTAPATADDIHPAIRPTSRAGNALAIIGVGAVLYWIYGDRPLVAQPWQWADDGLYLRQAEAFIQWLHGSANQWLGAYDPVLLSKAPLFAVWLGLLHILHLPLRLAEFGLLLLLPWLFRAAVRPMLQLNGWRWMLVAVILIGLPMLPQEQRLLRNAFQAALGGGCLISAVGLILRARTSSLNSARWAALTGLLFGLSYLNREETIWLLPVVFCALGAVLAGAWVKRNWRTAVIAMGSLGIAFAVPVTLVSLLNYKAYGIAITTMRRAPAFTRAHQVMTSLDPATREHFAPILTATRLKAYRLSPTFALMQLHLEGPATDSIARNPGHLALNKRPLNTREFFVSNFEFALRDAAFQAGARTAPEAEAMFARIEFELKSAVAAGKITAGNHGPSVMAAPLPGDYGQIFQSTFESLQKLYSLESMSFPAAGISSGEPHDLQRTASLTNTSLTPTQEMKPTELPDVGGGIRSGLYQLLTKLDRVIYAVSTLAILGFVASTLWWHRSEPAYWERAFAGLVLGGALVAFSLSMAVVHVLGFPILQWAAPYNYLGFTPLSVLSAFGLALLMAWVQPARTKPASPETASR